jgi:hypothetical protein
MHSSLASRSSISPLGRPAGFARSARQREWEADQAAWEAKLRKLAGRLAVEGKPASRIPHEPRILEPAGRAKPLDALLLPRSLPALVGTEQSDLACFGCAGIIGQAITARTARREHPEGARLVARCTCGALNLVCSDRAVRGR